MSHERRSHSFHDAGLSMTCRELFERLSEYLDGELSPDICQEISRHMEGCAPASTSPGRCRRRPTSAGVFPPRRSPPTSPRACTPF